MSKIERIKAETDGLDVLPELLRAARDGWETLGPDHVGLLKWYGLYAHNTGDGHFMMRVKVIQGKLSAAQVETMASIAEDFGRGVIDCTTRQCFQIHWIRLENIPEIFGRLERVGMTTSGACGDITRNVVGCTVSGLAHDEIVDGYATSEAIHELLPGQQALLEPAAQVQGLGHRLRRGLRARPDQRHRALRRRSTPDGTKGFNLRVGGGLSTQPRFARWVDIFVTPEEAPEVVAAVTGHLPRLRGEPEGARQGAPEVPRRPHRARGAARGDRRARVGRDAAPRRPEGAGPVRARTTSASSRRPTARTARSASSSRSAG